MTLQGEGQRVRPSLAHTASLPRSPNSHGLVRGALKQAGQLPPLAAVGGQVQGVLLVGVLHGAALGQVPAHQGTA